MLFSKLNGSAKKTPKKRPSRAQRRRRLHRNLETLESRQLLASLAGEVWADANSDGVRNPGEDPAISARVYIDVNDDGVFDADEPFTRTNLLGQYAFDQVEAGTHVVRVDLTAGQTQTSPRVYFGSETTAASNGTETQVFQLDASGVVEPLGSPTSVAIDAVVENNAGSLFGLDSTTNVIYRIDQLTGVPIQLSAAIEDLQGGLAHDPSTDTIYAVVSDAGVLQLREVNQFSGSLSDPFVPAPNLRAINFGSTFHDFDPIAQTAVEVPRGFLSPFADTLDSRSDGTIFGMQGDDLKEFSFPASGSAGVTVSTFSQPIEAISFGAGDQLYGVSSSPSAFHQIDLATGVVSAGTPILSNGEAISGVTGFDIGPDGTHYLVDSTHLYTFDPDTGIATQAANRALPPFSPIFTSLTVSEDGRLFATYFNTTTPLGEIDPTTGLATRLGNGPLGAPYSAVVASGFSANTTGLNGVTASDLAFDTENQRIVGFDDDADTFFAFDVSGNGTTLAAAQVPLNSSSLAFNGTDFVMFDADDPTNQSVLTVDPDTGLLEQSFQTSTSVNAQALDFSVRGNANRVEALSNDAITGLNFGLAGEVNRPSIGEGLYINELLIDPLFERRETHQAIEIRGVPGSIIPNNTYLLGVSEDSSVLREPGSIRGVFDLSGQVIGDNGFLVLLPEGSPYETHPDATTLRSTSPGFGGLPGNIYSDDSSNSDAFSVLIGSTGYFLIESDVAPSPGDDIDTDDDGFADPGGIKDGWKVWDSIALHPFVGGGDKTYADIVFVERGVGDIDQRTRPEGVPQVVRESVRYAARIGDSVGSDVSDWVVGTATDTSSGNQSFQLGFEDGIHGVPVPLTFRGRDIDHFGESNFVGGVRGTVNHAPAVEGDPVADPAEGVIVLADTNGNGRQDILTYTIDPDQYPIGTDLTNELAGATLVTHQPGFGATGSTGFEITSVAESFFNPNGNRTFAHVGIGFFNENSRHFRADFYRPARSASIEGISGGGTTYLRLEAYDADGNLIGSDTTGPLNGTARELLTVTAADDVIAYVEAYSMDDFIDENGATISSSVFGTFDRFSFSQSEATAITNEFGEYEITNLFPDQYNVTFLNPQENADLIGAQPVPLVIGKYENFILEPNFVPVANGLTADLPENSPVGTPVGFVSGSDDDGPVTYTVLSGSEHGLEVDTLTGQITVGTGAVLNFEQTPVIQVQVGVVDELGAIAIADVVVTLQDVNEPPIVTPVDLLVSEDTAATTPIGRLQAADPDANQNQTLTFTVEGGTGANTFSVDPSTGLVTLDDANAIDFESQTSATLQIRVTDSGTPARDTVYTQLIKVGDANDAPELLVSDLTIAENSVGLIGVLGVQDADVNDTHIFSLDGGTGANTFDLLGDGSIVIRPSASLDFESVNSYTLEFNVLDNGAPPLFDSETITVTITDIDEPVQLQANGSSVGENATAGTLVSTISVIDPEGVTSGFSATLASDGDFDKFVLDPTTLELSVAPDAVFDFETNSTLELVVEVEDTTGASPTVQLPLIIGVVDQNDAPSVVETVIRVSELAQEDTILGAVGLTDPDQNETLTAQIVGGTGADLFQLDPIAHTLTLATGAELDADGDNAELTLDVEVTDNAGAKSIGTITIRLNNVNEPPIFTSPNLEVPDAFSGQEFELKIPDDFIVDPEGGDFQISVFGPNGSLPDWLTYNSITRTLYGVPDPRQLGSDVFTVRAFEFGSLDLFNEFTFTVNVSQGSTPLTNMRDRLDVTNDEAVRPLDALRVINFLSAFGVQPASVSTQESFTGFLDVNGDGLITPLDVLLVLNGLALGQSGVQTESIESEFLDSNAKREEAVDQAIGQLTESMLF